jgi:hypothetical protein
MRNWFSRPRGPSNKPLTGYLQRYIVIGHERNCTYSNFRTSNMLLQIMRSEYNVIWITGRDEFAEEHRNVPVNLTRRHLAARRTSPLNNWMFRGEMIDIKNLIWIRKDKC